MSAALKALALVVFISNRGFITVHLNSNMVLSHAHIEMYVMMARAQYVHVNL